MIKIGINENVFYHGASYDEEKNWLTVTFEQKSDGPKFASAYDRLNADEAVENLPTKDLLIFVPKEPKLEYGEGKDKKTRTKEQRVTQITADITSVKAILIHIMEGYMTKEEFKFDMYAGLNITPDTYDDQILKANVFTGVFKNMATQFISKMAPYANKEDKLFRLLLVRQSPVQAFPTFRSKYVKENPFFESMEIPVASSKVAFTPYELKEELNSDLPVSRKDTDKKGNNGGGGSASTEMTAAGVFGA